MGKLEFHRGGCGHLKQLQMGWLECQLYRTCQHYLRSCQYLCSFVQLNHPCLRCFHWGG
jgi:hypothetical protein